MWKILPFFSSRFIHSLHFLHKLREFHLHSMRLWDKVLKVCHLLLVVVEELVLFGRVNRKVTVSNVPHEVGDVPFESWIHEVCVS